MTKEVMVSIRGLQFDQEMDSEEIETIQWGQYYKKNDTHYIIYDELMEGCDEPTRDEPDQTGNGQCIYGF